MRILFQFVFFQFSLLPRSLKNLIIPSAKSPDFNQEFKEKFKCWTNSPDSNAFFVYDKRFVIALVFPLFCTEIDYKNVKTDIFVACFFYFFLLYFPRIFRLIAYQRLISLCYNICQTIFIRGNSSSIIRYKCAAGERRMPLISAHSETLRCAISCINMFSLLLHHSMRGVIECDTLNFYRVMK